MDASKIPVLTMKQKIEWLEQHCYKHDIMNTVRILNVIRREWHVVGPDTILQHCPAEVRIGLSRGELWALVMQAVRSGDSGRILPCHYSPDQRQEFLMNHSRYNVRSQYIEMVHIIYRRWVPITPPTLILCYPTSYLRYAQKSAWAEIKDVAQKNIYYPEKFVPDCIDWEAIGFAELFQMAFIADAQDEQRKALVPVQDNLKYPIRNDNLRVEAIQSQKFEEWASFRKEPLTLKNVVEEFLQQTWPPGTIEQRQISENLKAAGWKAARTATCRFWIKK